LQEALEKLPPLIKSGGRLAVITFHSGEDRIVKEFGRACARDYVFEGNVDIPELRKERAPILKIITRRPVEAAEEEVKVNPRARSARLRVYEKILTQQAMNTRTIRSQPGWKFLPFQVRPGSIGLVLLILYFRCSALRLQQQIMIWERNQSLRI
jgi:hypothetical protein